VFYLILLRYFSELAHQLRWCFRKRRVSKRGGQFGPPENDQPGGAYLPVRQSGKDIENGHNDKTGDQRSGFDRRGI
jgi:hypothetical protein